MSAAADTNETATLLSKLRCVRSEYEAMLAALVSVIHRDSVLGSKPCPSIFWREELGEPSSACDRRLGDDLPSIASSHTSSEIDDEEDSTLMRLPPRRINVSAVDRMSAPTRTGALTVADWKRTAAARSVAETDSQFEYYKRHCEDEDILRMASMSSKQFGTFSEKIIAELMMLSPRTSSQNDGVCGGVKVEIKCARYWANGTDCKWQHLEPDHDYDVAVFVLLTFTGFEVWAIKKSTLMGDLRERKLVTHQGRQGWWTKKSSISTFLTPIHSASDLQTFCLAASD
jgi:hypothetical protein